MVATYISGTNLHAPLAPFAYHDGPLFFCACGLGNTRIFNTVHCMAANISRRFTPLPLWSAREHFAAAAAANWLLPARSERTRGDFDVM